MTSVIFFFLACHSFCDVSIPHDILYVQTKVEISTDLKNLYIEKNPETLTHP